MVFFFSVWLFFRGCWRPKMSVWFAGSERFFFYNIKFCLGFYLSWTRGSFHQDHWWLWSAHQIDGQTAWWCSWGEICFGGSTCSCGRSQCMVDSSLQVTKDAFLYLFLLLEPNGASIRWTIDIRNRECKAGPIALRLIWSQSFTLFFKRYPPCHKAPKINTANSSILSSFHRLIKNWFVSAWLYRHWAFLILLF